jgi:flagellar hook-basal body complex protein FliE
MSSPEINSVLAQMRMLSQEIQSPQSTGAGTAASGQVEGTGFAAAMQEAVAKVNLQQSAAAAKLQSFETGVDDTSVAEVMIEMQKASVSFQAMTEVRNRLVEAYREIMSMPL